MKKSMKRYLAMLLAMVLILQQGSAIGTLADESEPASEVAVVKTTEAQSVETGEKTGEEKREEAKEPETKAPEAQTPETKQEETKAQETQTSETKKEETKPEETKPAEPQSEAKTDETTPTEAQTEAPKDEAVTEPESKTETVTEQTTESETVAEQTTETVTEAASESETEKETESESEKETEAGPTLLTAECEGVTVKVEAGEGVLKAGTVLKMEKAVNKGQVFRTIQNTLDEDTEVDKNRFLAYDITLMMDGKEVQPEGQVTVSFSGVPFTTEENEELIVAHLNDEETSALGTISMFSATSDVSSVEIEKGLSIKTTHFSEYLVAVLKKAIKNNPPEGQPGHKNFTENAKNKAENLKDIPSKYEPQNYYYFCDEEGNETVLDSSAFDFHIFANDVTIEGAHTNGNIAANNYTGGNIAFGNHQNNGTNTGSNDPSDLVEEYNYFGESANGIGEVAGGTIVVGKDVKVDPQEDGRINVGENGAPVSNTAKVYQEEDGKYLDIAKELEKLEQFSKDLVKIGTNMTKDKELSDMGITIEDKDGSSDQKVLKVKKKSEDSKVVYYNVDWKDLINAKWDIEVEDGITLVVNVDMTGVTSDALANLNIQSLNGHNNSEDVVYSNCNLLWNFYMKDDSTGEVLAYTTNTDDYTQVSTGGTFMGTILAPKANIQFGAVNGSVIASKAKHTNAESHKWTFTGMIARITVHKELNDSSFKEGDKKTFWFAVFDNEHGTGKPIYGPKSVTFETGRGTKSIVFPDIELEEKKTYYIFEVDSDGKPVGKTYDGYTVAGSGKAVELDPSKKGNHYTSGAITIRNEKKADVEAQIFGTKELTGIDTSNEKFYFDLYEIVDGAEKFVESTEVTGEGSFSFRMSYSKDEKGEHKYVVKERDLDSSTSAKGYTKDVREFKVTVSVIDRKMGAFSILATAVKYDDGPISFTNTCTTGSIVVTKKVTLNGTVDTTVAKDFKVALYNAENKKVAEKVVSVANGVGVVTFDKLELGTYTVYELDASGNIVGNGFEYEVTGSGTTVTLTRENLQGNVEIKNNISKGGLKVKKSFAGAEGLTVAQKNAITFIVTGPNNYSNTFPYSSMTNGEKTLTDLAPGTYTVTESNADVDGYTVKTEYSVTGGKTTVTANTTAEVVVTNTYTQEKGSLKIRKNVTVNGAAPIGMEADGTYKFEVKDASGKKVGDTVEIKVENGASSETTVRDLVPGTYTVTELTDGLKEGMSLTGKNNIKVTVEAGTTATVPTAEFTNNLIVVKVSKVDVATGAELEGAHIQILDKEGNVVEEWDSKKEAHEVKGLKTGETYTLKETVAPDGYTLTTETTFTLNEDGSVDSGKTTAKSKNGILLVEDSLNKVSIEKVDESGAVLAGAKLVIKNADNEVADSWTTDGKAHEITGLAKGTYTLSELEAPEGYQVSKDKKFEITGKEEVGEVIKVKMTDNKIVETKRSLQVTKQLRLEGLSEAGNILVRSATYYVALFTDEARTERVTDVKKIVFSNETSSSVTFENLEAGMTYYVGETDAEGTVIPAGRLSPRMLYYPTYDGTAMYKFEGSKPEEKGLAGFTNVYVELPDNFYLAGQLTVTKKVLVNGEKANSDDVFYAGVFTDAGLTQLVGNVLTLNMAGGSETSVTVTNLTIGNKPGSSRTYYVAETDEYGNPLNPDVITEYTISVDKSEVTLSGYESHQAVVITNDFVEEEETESEEEIESEEETETEVDEKKTAPKTGDDTDFMKYLFLMALSAGLGGIAVGQKRRKAKRARK